MSDDRLPDLYLEALELDAAGRRALLQRVAADAPELAAELRRLLEAESTAPSPIDAAPPELREVAAGRRSFPERVGPYRLLREVGQGGMGRVFLAVQETPDFRRTVALKLIDRPGLDDQAVRRFRDEVRILASLDHPGIVRFLDGGLSPEGIWFLALEYVEGDDLLTHARRLDLDIDGRVELVAAVAEAVAFAHVRGVVHRDLKPSNVLVGVDGRPRLLDFGISKLLDRADESGHTTTHHGFRPLTPAYASPEQIEGRPATAASDIYSLGVVLYELLSGGRPITTSTPPEPPSAAARRGPFPGGAPRRAGSTSGRESRRRISRDLDAICLKALQRNPTDRYEGALELAADLRRYLDREPVAARPRRGAWFLVRAGRHPARRIALVALLALAAVFGAWSYLRPHPTPVGAVAGAPPNRSAAGGLFPFDPINPPPAEESERQFAEAPDDLVVGAALAIRLARDQRADEAWIVLGRLRQIPGAEDDPLVDYAAAVVAGHAEEFQRSLVFLTRAKESAIARKRPELLGTIRAARGMALERLGHREAAEAELVQARLELERAGDHRPLYRALVALAAMHYERGEIDQCVAMYEAAIRSAEAADFEPLIAWTGLAEVNLLRGRPDLAEPLARAPVEPLRSHPSPHRLADALSRLALVVRDLGRTGEANALLDEAISGVSPERGASALADGWLARAHFDLESGRFDRIDSLVEGLEALAAESQSRRPLAFARTVAGRKAALGGDLAGARALFAEARRLYLAEGYRDYAALSDLALAEAEAWGGDAAAAEAILDTALAGFDEASAILPRFFSETLRARLAAEAGDTTVARRRLEALGAGLAESPSFSRRIAFLAARAALAASEGRKSDARGDLEAALEIAVNGGRKLAELELRLELARLAGRDGNGANVALRVEQEARGLGYLALAERARRTGEPEDASRRL